MNFSYSFRLSTNDLSQSQIAFKSLGFKETSLSNWFSNDEILIELRDEWFESPTLVLYPDNVDEYFDFLQGLGILVDYHVDEWSNLEYQFYSPEGLRVLIAEERPELIFPQNDKTSFQELRLACPLFSDSVNFWHSLGFQLGELPKSSYPMTRLSQQNLTIGLHHHQDIKTHSLCFTQNKPSDLMITQPVSFID